MHLIFLPRVPTGVEGTDRFLATEVEVKVEVVSGSGAAAVVTAVDIPAGDSGNTNVDADETEDVEEVEEFEEGGGEEGPGRARTGLGTLCMASKNICEH